MSNEIRIGNTPIFDQLCQDFASIGIHFERLIAGGPIHLRQTRGGYTARPIEPVTPTQARVFMGFEPKLTIVDEAHEDIAESREMEQTDDAVDAATSQQENLELFQAAAVRTLFEKNKME